MGSEGLVTRLRRRILSGLHRGTLHPGDRLPSIRSLSEEWGADHRPVSRAYRALEAEGLVEVRPRSGVYVAPQERVGGADGVLPDTARWVTDIIRETWLRRIPLPELPHLIERCTLPGRLSCVCVDSCGDALVALCSAAEEDFGLAAEALDLSALGDADRARVLRDRVGSADIVMTTVFHSAEVRPVVEELGKSFVVFKLNPDWAAELRKRAGPAGLTVLMVDPATEPRYRAVFEGVDDLVFVPVSELDAVEAVPDDRPVYVTAAARACVGEVDHPSLVVAGPVMSPETAEALAHEIVRSSLSRGMGDVLPSGS